jgi:acyl-CoA synthetase (AMP-forming)/AMP-acid ligase II
MTDIASPFRSLVDLLCVRAAEQRDDKAFAFISEAGDEKDAMTFGELDRRARAMAGRLQAQGARAGDRALLVFPPGIAFFTGYFGCLYAGMIPVPVVPPRRSRLRLSTLSIAQDCRPTVGLTVDGMVDELPPEFAGVAEWDAIRWHGVVGPPATGDTLAAPEPAAAPYDAKFEDVAFLQYTSGSTSAPKGVMVGHGNLVLNLEMIKRTLGNGRSSTYVSWVPLYHDMGLILNALQTLYVGSLCVLMAPAGFMQRPLTWLSAISRYKAEVAGGPNFGYDLCVSRFRPERMEGVDLSRWRLAFNGAEPVRAETLRRFAQTFAPYGFDRRALYPCYGMAEGTLLLSGGRREADPVITPLDRRSLHQQGQAAPATVGIDRAAPAEHFEAVGCGAELPGERLAIVDPETRREVAPGRVGEIWAAGPHIAQGYWKNEAATTETFRAHIAETGEGPFLRTGDLGFMLDGELYIAGRLKDVIIIRGENYYPQDIEATAASAHPALRPGFGAAFTIEAGDNQEEKLVIVHEVERTWRNKIDTDTLAELVRQAVVAEHELGVYAVIFIRPGTLPKTSSGKVRRRLTRQLYLDSELETWGTDEPTPATAISAVETAAASGSA